MPSPKLLPTAVAADFLGVERSTLTRWVEKGIIQPAMRLPGLNGPMLFAPADLTALKTKIARQGMPRRWRLIQKAAS